MNSYIMNRDVKAVDVVSLATLVVLIAMVIAGWVIGPTILQKVWTDPGTVAKLVLGNIVGAIAGFWLSVAAMSTVARLWRKSVEEA